jgi:hypothetical protein
VAGLVGLPVLVIVAALLYRLVWGGEGRGTHGAEAGRTSNVAVPDAGDVARLHSLFAHRVLPDLAFEDPLQFMAVLASPDAEQRLHELWMDAGRSLAGEQAGGAAAAHDVPSSDGLAVTRTRLGSRACAVIRMPPSAERDVLFAAAVLDHNLDQSREAAPDAHPELFYFTLEQGTNLTDGSPRTVLYRWRPDRSRDNLGDGPPAEQRAFLEAVERMVA